MGRKRWLLASFLAAILSCGSSEAVLLRNDQLRPTCNKREFKRWLRDYDALSDQQKEWLELGVVVKRSIDLNNDGTKDALEIIATQYVRECSITSIFPYKEVQVAIVDGVTGKKQLWHWKAGIPDKYAVNMTTRKLVVEGYDSYGGRWNKELSYE